MGAARPRSPRRAAGRPRARSAAALPLAGEHAAHQPGSRALREWSLVVDVMGEFKQRPLTETVEIPLLWKGILDSLLTRAVVPVGTSAYGLWSRLSARFARCSTTGGCGPSARRTGLVSSDRSLRSLLDHRWLQVHRQHEVGSGLQELKDRKDSAVVVGRVEEAQLGEDVADVALDGLGRERDLLRRSPGWTGPRPSGRAPRAPVR